MSERRVTALPPRSATPVPVKNLVASNRATPDVAPASPPTTDAPVLKQLAVKIDEDVLALAKGAFDAAKYHREADITSWASFVAQALRHEAERVARDHDIVIVPKYDKLPPGRSV